MGAADLRGLIDRLAGLSLSTLEKSLPDALRRRAGPEWLDQFRDLRTSLEGKPEAFWADALVRVAEGDQGYVGSEEFRLAYAAAQFKRAGGLFKAGGQEALAAKGFFRAALAYRGLGRESDWRKALKNFASVTAIRGQGRGSVPDLERAIRAYEQCIAATDKETERALWAELQADLAFARRGVGLINNDKGALSAATAAFEAASTVLVETGEQAALWSRVKNSLGATLSKLGELESDPTLILSAIAAYQEALRARPLETRPTLWLGSWTNIMQAEFLLAKVTRDAGRLRRAHEQMLARLQSAGAAQFSREQCGHTYRQLGGNAQLLGEMERRAADLRAAITFYDRALAAFSGAKMPYALAQIEAHRTAAEYRLGEIEADPAIMVKALVAHQRGETRFSQQEQPYLWAHWHQTLGRIHLSLARHRDREEHLRSAQSAFERALEEYRPEVYPQQWAETTRALCETLEKLAATTEDWRQLTALADDLIQSVHALALAGLSRPQQRALLRCLQGLGDMAAYAHVRLEQRDRAFAMLSLARAVGSDLSFRLAGGRSAVPEGFDKEAFARWQKLQASSDQKLREALENARQAKPIAADELKAHRDSFSALLTLLTASGALQREKIEPEAFAAHLTANSVAAMVFVSERGGGIIVVAPGMTTIPPAAVIDMPRLTRTRLDVMLHGEAGRGREGWLAAYERYRKESSSYDEEDVERAVIAWNGTIEAILPELWELAMGPLADWLSAHAEGAREVTLLVPGLLSLLPLHGARADSEDAPYFAQRWAVSYLPSPRAVLNGRNSRHASQARLLAVTDPAGDIGADENPAWPFFADGRRHNVRGDAPAVAAALETARDVSHICFFCHGLWEASDPDLSHLVMADGSQLSAAQLASIDLRSVDLAVLGACESALIGTRGTPDEFTGLPLAFLQAGVSAVVASQWLVDAASTYALVHRLMEGHRSGLSPARALQAAQRAFLAGEMDDHQDIPVGTAFLSRLRTLRPLSPSGARAWNTDADPMAEISGQREDDPVLARGAPFFWAAFAVIGSA